MDNNDYKTVIPSENRQHILRYVIHQDDGTIGGIIHIVKYKDGSIEVYCTNKKILEEIDNHSFI